MEGLQHCILGFRFGRKAKTQCVEPFQVSVDAAPLSIEAPGNLPGDYKQPPAGNRRRIIQLFEAPLESLSASNNCGQAFLESRSASNNCSQASLESRSASNNCSQVSLESRSASESSSVGRL